jgi:nucleoside-diphosphate-sugar epimerase
MPNIDQPSVFVTGATGLVGGHLIARLAADGLRPRCLVRATSNTADLKRAGVELATGDITDPPEKLRQLIGDCRLVFHCAGLVDDWAPRAEMVRINIDGTRNMLEACVGLGRLEKFVMVGSMVVFGMGPQNNLDESAPLTRTGDNYNETKIVAEELAFQYAAEKKVPVVVCRPPYVYGPGDKQFFPRLFESLRDGVFKYIGDGNQPITLVYVLNLIEALVLAARTKTAPGELFLITDGESITRRELAEMICREMGYRQPTAHVPEGVARALLPVVEWLAKVRHQRPILNRFKLKFMATPLVFDISKGRRVLGYEPVEPPRESLRKTIRWYREHHPEMAAKDR